MVSARSCALLLSVASGLMPVIASGESQLHAGGGSSSASAHLNFRIIIPQVLYLNTGATDGHAAQPAVFSNGRNVALVTTVQGAGAAVTAHLILSGAGRRAISRISACATAREPGRTVASGRLVCTASTP